MKLLILATLALPVLASADLKKIEGTWKPTAGQMGANALPKAFLDKMVLTIKNGKYDYDEGHGHDLGTLKEVGKKAPLGLDITGTEGPNKGKTYLTIYKLEGKSLVISYGLDGKRPTSFDPKAKGMTMLMTYRRG